MNAKESVSPVLQAAFLETKLASVHPKVREWVPKDCLERNLQSDLEASIKKCANIAYAQRMSELCPVDGAQPQDYSTQLLSFDKRHALTEIRFKGMSVDHPFVQISGTNFVLEDTEALCALTEEVRARYEVFNPKMMRVELGSHQVLEASDSDLRFSRDLRCLVAPVEDLQRSSPPAHADEITLRRCEDGSAYDNYRRTYDRFTANTPIIGNEIYVLGPKEFDELVKQGHTYDVLVENEWAGLIAAVAEPYLGVPSFTVHEEILDTAFRGRGLAAATQRKMIDLLDPREGQFVFGTIHALNAPSIATAQRVGRFDVGGFFFLELSSDRATP